MTGIENAIQQSGSASALSLAIRFVRKLRPPAAGLGWLGFLQTVSQPARWYSPRADTSRSKIFALVSLF